MANDVRRTAPLELLNLSALLTDDERDIAASVRAMVDEHVRPHVAQWFEDGTLPARELAREFGRLGVLGMHLEGYGCAGLNATAYGVAAWRSRRPTRASARWCRCRAAWRCTRSTRSAATSRSSSGCRGWPPARRSAASA